MATQNRRLSQAPPYISFTVTPTSSYKPSYLAGEGCQGAEKQLVQGHDIHGRHAKASTTTCSSSLLPRGDMSLRGVTMDCTDMFVNP